MRAKAANRRVHKTRNRQNRCDSTPERSKQFKTSEAVCFLHQSFQLKGAPADVASGSASFVQIFAGTDRRSMGDLYRAAHVGSLPGVPKLVS